jgi:hypothetical protein
MSVDLLLAKILRHPEIARLHAFVTGVLRK